MIYITEMDMADRSRLDEWHTYYLGQIANLQTVPGFRASQRFEAIVPTPSPFVAVHDIAGPEMFTSHTYKQRGGRASNGSWQPLMTRWHRNLYAWPGATPDVAPDQCLVFVDAQQEEAQEIPWVRTAGVRWLELTGLDRTIAHRGLVVTDDVAAAAAAATADPRVKVFRPITPKILQRADRVSEAD